MARRYTRDNRGRFASVGATARGGRLRTAAGNKRETVKASPGIATRMSSAPKGTVGKTRSARFSQHVDRPLQNRPAYKQRFNDQKAEIADRKTPAKKAPPKQAKSGQEVVNASIRKNQNKKLRGLNEQIKAAGPNAAGLRVEKLALQSRMSSTKPKPNARQQAKEQASTNALRARVSRMKRAQTRYEATADTRNQPGSKMVRRPDPKTSRGNRRAEQARAIYMGASIQNISNYAKGVARTSKARNNWMQPRSARVAQAKRAGLPLATVSSTRRRK